MAFPYYLLAQNIQPSAIRTAVNKAVDLTYQNKDSALYIANSALVAAQKADSVQLVFVAYRTIGYIHETNNDLQKAQNAYFSALSIAQNRLKMADQLLFILI